MLDSLTHPLRFPDYSEVAQLEGADNCAVRNYYRWPHRYFYRHKVRMIERMLRGRSYKNLLDFGSGVGLLVYQWHEYSENVYMMDKGDIWPKDKMDLIICASVMEFVPLKETFEKLADSLLPGGDIVVASPMDTELSAAYFNFIGDRNTRHSHSSIMSEMTKHFNIRKYHTWLDLYFCAIGKKR